MKIIKHGKKPVRRVSVYGVVCSGCKCEFEFDSDEMFSHCRQMFGDVGTVVCPDCGKMIKVRDKNFVREEIEDEGE